MAMLTYLCPCCNESGGELKTIDQIGFSLSEALMNKLKGELNRLDTSNEMANFTRDLTSDGRFLHLGEEDIRRIFPGKKENTTHYTGEMIITWGWIRDKATQIWEAEQRLQELESLNRIQLAEDRIIYSREFYELIYHPPIDGVYVPKELRRTIDSNTERLGTQMRRCSCGRPLCDVTGTAEEIIVVLQGSTRASKTTTMVALIRALSTELLDKNEARDETLPEITILQPTPHISDANDRKDPQNWLSRQLGKYKQGQKVEKTPQEGILDEMIFSVELTVNRKKYVLTMVDMAGEIFDGARDDLVPQDWHSRYLYVYRKCHAIWTYLPYQTAAQDFEFSLNHLVCHREYFSSCSDAEKEKYNALINGDQAIKNKFTIDDFLKETAELTTESEPQPKLLAKYQPLHTKRIAQTLGETAETSALSDYDCYENRIKKIRDKLSDPPPHAIILTKTDGIAGLFLPFEERETLDSRFIYPKERGTNEEVLKRRRDKTLYLDEAAINRVNRGVRGFFRDQKSNMLRPLSYLNPNESCCFALSACGGAVVPDSPQKPVPYNVKLPLLWTLAANGFLPVGYYQTEVSPRPLLYRCLNGNTKTVKTVLMTERFDRKANAGSLTAKNLFARENAYQFHESLK